MFEHTKSELERLKAERIVELIEHAGSYSHLALMIGTTTPTVIGWAKRGQISKRAAKIVSNHPTLGKKFPALYLRPDVLVDVK